MDDDLQEAVIRGRAKRFSEEYVVFDIENHRVQQGEGTESLIGAVKIRGRP